MSARTQRDGFGVLGVGIVACAACCIGPILTVLGGVGIAGFASTWFIGGAGLVIATAAALAYAVINRRRPKGCDVASPAEPVPVVLADRRGTR